MEDIRSCIHQVPIFQVLPEESLLRLRRAMHHRRLSPAEVILYAGDPVDHLVVVAQGLLKLVRVSRSGREQVIRELGPGEFFGEMGLFTPMVAVADLVALTETDACLLRRDAVQAELASYPQVAVALVEALAKRLADAERTIGELALMDVGQRLASELLRLCQGQRQGQSEGQSEVRSAGAPGHDQCTTVGAHAQDVPGSGRVSDPVVSRWTGAERAGTVSFELPYSWAEMASRLATTPESLSRRLRVLVDDGIVEVDGRTVTVRDVDALYERTM